MSDRLAAARKEIAQLARREGAIEYVGAAQRPLPAIPEDLHTRLDWAEAFYEHFSQDAVDNGREWGGLFALKNLPTQLLSRGDYDPDALTRVISAAVGAHEWLSMASVIGAAERCASRHSLPEATRDALRKLRARRQARASTQDHRKELARIDALLGVAASSGPDPAEAWGAAAIAYLATLPEDARAAWAALFSHAQLADGARPAQRWSKTARELIGAVGDAVFKERVAEWFSLVRKPDAPRTFENRWYGETLSRSQLGEANEDLLRGLVWACALLDDAAMARALGDLAVVCFTKIPGLGALSPKVGNACVYALGAAPGLEGVAQLGRLKTRVKYAVANRLIEKALDAEAERTGLDKTDLEDLAVPTFGLDAPGVGHFAFGEWTAELTVGDGDTPTVSWLRGETRRASAPSELKTEHGAAIKALKKTAKDIASMLAAQRVRLERLLGGERSWRLADARVRFLDHALVAPIARRLVWHVADGGRSTLALWRDDRFEDVQGRAVTWANADARVSLWHPLGFDVDVVRAWRAALDERAVTQPFKQAYRELYLLTDAEIQTATYSNRFAAHVLRQHQLAALCRARGWSYALQGGFDGANSPTLRLPQAGLAASFWVESAEQGGLSASGISLYVATDQVRFTRIHGSEAVPLREVPALVFSEVMRDVDLFVGVCSVGNDPTWRDRGEGHETYWNAYAFGVLSESAITRRAALERILPRLKIADRCTLADRFLVVRGELRTYKIHLGSTNILMEPNDQYLCIVPDRSAGARGEAVRLPFEGDTTLAIILSKALMLAADRKIKDESILRQIRRS